MTLNLEYISIYSFLTLHATRLQLKISKFVTFRYYVGDVLARTMPERCHWGVQDACRKSFQISGNKEASGPANRSRRNGKHWPFRWKPITWL